jgi:hypothetical protein
VKRSAVDTVIDELKEDIAAHQREMVVKQAMIARLESAKGVKTHRVVKPRPVPKSERAIEP